MSFSVDGTTIRLTRGDSGITEVGMKQGNTPYVPVQGDSLRFALKHAVMNATRTAYKDNVPVLEKQIPIDTCLLEFVPSDTAKLDFGDYVYDIELKYANGMVDTFINNAKFVLVAEVADG